MEQEPETITDIKEDVEMYRNRLATDWQDIRSAVNPREFVEDTIRQNPIVAVATAAIFGVVAASSFLPRGKRSPLGFMMGSALTLASKGLLMAATPAIAKHMADVVDPARSENDGYRTPAVAPATSRFPGQA